MKQDSFEQPSFLGLPVCPYCGRRLNPFVAWLYKTKGEYRCPACSHFSNVIADRKTPVFGIVAVSLSLAVFLIFLFANGKVPLWGISLMVVPFFLFTLFAPFLVRLEKLPQTAPKPERQKSRQPARQQRQLPRVTAPAPRPAPQHPEPRSRPPAPRTPPAPPKREPLSPYAHPASRPPQARNPQPARPTVPPSQSPQRSPKPNLYPSMPPAPAPRSQQSQRGAPPAGSRPAPTGRPVQTNRPAPRPGSTPNARPNLFDTAEFGKRAPRDFSGYQDK